jgi:cell fate regulator YaaT (PSP1 superfamily)
MDEMVGVCFKPTGKVYYFSAAGLGLKSGEFVVAETTKGQELAEVVSEGPFSGRPKEAAQLKPVLRRATPADVERSRENQRRGCEARRVCLRLLTQLELPVKLVDVEFAFDGSRVTFAFASEDRVDFRQLQHELREIYDCEVEIRQIGVRDQAKILGGLGPCGRHLCCASFLRSFQPVTIRMAKEQDLSLNPTKISGLCGRLMCCLRYEHQVYRAAREGLPEVGAVIETKSHGRVEVAALDVLARRVTIHVDDGVVQIDADEIESVVSKKAQTAAKAPAERVAPKAPPARAVKTPAPREPSARPEPPAAAPPPAEEGEAGAKKRRRRGRRSRRRRKSGEPGQAAPAAAPSE